MTTTDAPAPARSPIRRVITVALVIVVVALVAYVVLARVAYDTMSLTGERRPELLPETPFEEVSFPSRGRDYPVYAFWQTTSPDVPVIINVHG